MSSKNVEDICGLSPLQEVMLFQSLYAPQSGVYMEQVILPFNGRADSQGFRQAWEHVVQTYPSLRTSYHWEGLRNPVQVVLRKVQLPWAEHDWTRLSPRETEKRVAQFLEQDRRRGFDLSKAPLVRFAWLRLSTLSNRLIWTFHHSVLDGWSVQLVIKAVSETCQRLSMQKTPAAIQVHPFSEYITWLKQQDVSAGKAFWRETLDGFEAPTRFNIDHAGDSVDVLDSEFGEEHIVISASTTRRLRDVCRQNQLTMNTIVQAAWAIILSHYSTEQDVLFGAVVSGRPAELAGVESMVGMFINTLPVRVRVDPDSNLIDFLQRVQADQLAARAFEYSHLVEIQEVSSIPAGTLMFESVMVFENFPVTTAWEDQKNQQMDSGLLERTNLPMTIMVIPASEVLIKILYARSRFDRATVRRTLAHFRVVIDAIAGSVDRTVGDIPLLTGAERRQLVDRWNVTKRRYKFDVGLVELAEAQCERTPDAVAFSFGEQSLTYAELNTRANLLARVLMERGAGPETLVGICIERSLDFAVALLATFKAGAAALPLDPEYPDERLAFMLRDASVPLILTRNRHASRLPLDGMEVVLEDDLEELTAGRDDSNIGQRNSPAQLAFVLYTSGSTGRPKGVLLEHRQIINRLCWMWEAYPFGREEVCCQKTPSSFIDSIWEFIGPLCRGIPVVIVPDEVLADLPEFIELIARHRVTRLWVVPSLLEALLDTRDDLEQQLPHLRFWVTTGEPLTDKLFKRFRSALPDAVLHNVYGTSEVWDATWHDPGDDPDAEGRPPIGRPIANVEAHVLDERMQPVPVGVPGELYVGGLGLARGYVGRPELTAERFLHNPFSRSRDARMYKTGDRVRRLATGTIEFVGRLDRQLKIRGVRVEPVEIEAALESHPDVARAAVVVQGGTRLVAYLVAAPDADPEESELRSVLRAKLLTHMIPAAFLTLAELPLTPSGKVDRVALSKLDDSGGSRTRSFISPRNETERVLLSIWSEILMREPAQISVRESFFDVGGHSLLATQLVSRVRSEFGVELPIRRLFEIPTIEELAQVIGEAEPVLAGEQAPAIQRLERD